MTQTSVSISSSLPNDGIAHQEQLLNGMARQRLHLNPWMSITAVIRVIDNKLVLHFRFALMDIFISRYWYIVLRVLPFLCLISNLFLKDVIAMPGERRSKETNWPPRNDKSPSSVWGTTTGFFFN